MNVNKSDWDVSFALLSIITNCSRQWGVVWKPDLMTILSIYNSQRWSIGWTLAPLHSFLWQHYILAYTIHSCARQLGATERERETKWNGGRLKEHGPNGYIKELDTVCLPFSWRSTPQLKGRNILYSQRNIHCVFETFRRQTQSHPSYTGNQIRTTTTSLKTFLVNLF